MLFLFLLITIIISTLIVIFLTKIDDLTAILEHAKEIDHAKEDRLSFLEDALMEEKIHSFQIQKEMEIFKKMKKEFEFSKATLSKNQEELRAQEKKYVEFFYKQKSALEKLKIHYKSLEESHDVVDEEYLALKQRYEDLVEEYNRLKMQKRRLEVKFVEQHKQKSKKIQMRDEHTEEFSRHSSKFF